ncbi:ATP-binding protein [Vibrio sp. 10N.261.51.F12]|uniref:ATP-binding protein n=1 Tax=Vibrio sp. 10N.261.51.F12 TaxID=3229679 RepID=UPI00354B2336
MSQKIDLLEEDDFRPSAARLVESLRDTGYSKEAAFADIIDNSIAANATRVEVELQYMMGEFRVIITDNGDGMSEEQLRSAMRYGSPRRNNPKSLGKFGMGLKTASTAFCRRLVVLSQQNGASSGRAWDIDKIIASDRWELETPDNNEYYDDYEALSEFSETSGTMIIWENIDRLVKAGSEKQMREQIRSLGEELSLELSAVFFKFLKAEEVTISMKVGDAPAVKLIGWDPLCSDLNRSGEGARSRVLKEKAVSVEHQGQNLSFTVKGGVIPSQNDLDADERDYVRYSLDNQGLYIYREGRLIWHDGWPHRMYKKESKITRLRVELNFTHELDDVFSIDFRKSRVIIPVEVREELKRLIAPWRQELLKGQNRLVAANTKRAHGPADKAIDKHKKHTKNSEIKVDGDTVTIRNQNQMKPTVIEGIRVYDDKTVRVHEEDSLLGDDLWEPSCDEEGNTCVTLGKSHPYFHKMYNVCKDNVEAMKALDMLLWSLSNAEHGEFSEANQHTLKGFRQKVSQTLRYLSIELPDAEEDE